MNGTEVLSSTRSGRFVRQERLDNGGRVQSWVVAGAKGAVEVRGTGPGNLYCLVHRMAARPEQAFGHGLLVLVDAEALGSQCTVLEGPCRVGLVMQPEGFLPGLDLATPWEDMEALYRRALGEP